MRFLIASLTVLLTVFAAAPAFAEDVAPATNIPLPINRGDWQIGGSAAFERNVRTNQRSVLLAPKAEYFFVNRFSAGGSLVYRDDNTKGTTYGIGPSATYYITHTDRFALALDQHVFWSKPVDGDNYVEGATGLVLDYFITPTIAIGPALRGYYYFNGGLNKPDDKVTLEFNFALFL